MKEKKLNPSKVWNALFPFQVGERVQVVSLSLYRDLKIKTDVVGRYAEIKEVFLEADIENQRCYIELEQAYLGVLKTLYVTFSDIKRAREKICRKKK